MKNNIEFNQTEHKKLWEYMGKRSTIKEMKDIFLEPLAYDNTLSDLFDLVDDTKSEYMLEHGFGDSVLCDCFACDTSHRIDSFYRCKYCPILIGCCLDDYEEQGNKFIYGTSLYNNYVCALYNYINKEEKLKTVQEFASSIANAELDVVIIKRYNIKVI